MDVTLNPNDSNIIELLGPAPEQAWSLFLEKYTSRAYGLFRHWGLEHKESGNCFTALCEQLVENDFRRLQEGANLQRNANLFPWLRVQARSVAIDWTVSPGGEERIAASASELSEFQQKIFDLYFRQGCAPPAVRKRLQAETGQNLLFIEILEQLEEVLSGLTKDPLWRLLSQMARQRRAERERATAAKPGERVQGQEDRTMDRDKREFERLWQAWAALDSRTALTLQLRYDDCQSVPQISLILGSSDDQVEGSIRSGLLRLRRSTSG